MCFNEIIITIIIVIIIETKKLLILKNLATKLLLKLMKSILQFVKYNIFSLRHIYAHNFLTYNTFQEYLQSVIIQGALSICISPTVILDTICNLYADCNTLYSTKYSSTNFTCPPKDISLCAISVFYIMCCYHHTVFKDPVLNRIFFTLWCCEFKWPNFHKYFRDYRQLVQGLWEHTHNYTQSRT